MADSIIAVTTRHKHSRPLRWPIILSQSQPVTNTHYLKDARFLYHSHNPSQTLNTSKMADSIITVTTRHKHSRPLRWPIPLSQSRPVINTQHPKDTRFLYHSHNPSQTLNTSKMADSSITVTTRHKHSTPLRWPIPLSQSQPVTNTQHLKDGRFHYRSHDPSQTLNTSKMAESTIGKPTLHFSARSACRRVVKQPTKHKSPGLTTEPTGLCAAHNDCVSVSQLLAFAVYIRNVSLLGMSIRNVSLFGMSICYKCRSVRNVSLLGTSVY